MLFQIKGGLHHEQLKVIRVQPLNNDNQLEIEYSGFFLHSQLSYVIDCVYVGFVEEKRIKEIIKYQDSCVLQLPRQ